MLDTIFSYQETFTNWVADTYEEVELQNVGGATALSAASSLAAGSLYSLAMTGALTGATIPVLTGALVAAAGSLVYALCIPLFKQLANDDSRINKPIFGLCSCIAVSIPMSLASMYLGFSPSLAAGICGLISLYRNPEEIMVNQVPFFAIF